VLQCNRRKDENDQMKCIDDEAKGINPSDMPSITWCKKCAFKDAIG